MHRDQIKAYLCGLMGKDKVEDIAKITPEKYKLPKGNSRNHIAVIYADGSIGSDIIGDELARTIEKVKADKNVKAVVFRVNSPGGAVMDSDIIRRAILQLQEDKIVIASYGDYAASGGYWISASAKRIFCSATTLTGSIGVFGMVPSYGEAIRRHLHVNPVVVGTHEHSDMFSGMRDLNDAELEWNQKSIETVYSNFVNLVADGRGMTPEAVDEIAQGRVWAGATAFEIGLADERGTLIDAIKYAAKEAGLSDFRIDCYPEVKDMNLRSLLSGKSDELPLVVTPFSEFPFLMNAQGPVVMALMESIITIY
jgi:protease-4